MWCDVFSKLLYTKYLPTLGMLCNQHPNIAPLRTPSPHHPLRLQWSLEHFRFPVASACLYQLLALKIAGSKESHHLLCQQKTEILGFEKWRFLLNDCTIFGSVRWELSGWYISDISEYRIQDSLGQDGHNIFRVLDALPQFRMPWCLRHRSRNHLTPDLGTTSPSKGKEYSKKTATQKLQVALSIKKFSAQACMTWVLWTINCSGPASVASYLYPWQRGNKIV